MLYRVSGEIAVVTWGCEFCGIIIEKERERAIRVNEIVDAYSADEAVEAAAAATIAAQHDVKEYDTATLSATLLPVDQALHHLGYDPMIEATTR